jgi:hypothetical protein
MSFIGRLWAEINNPNGGALIGAYTRAVIAGGHALLGACFASGGVWWAGLIVAVAYWLWKERGDLTRGGALLDGFEDTAMVWLGTFYGPLWWPPLMMACMAYIMAVGAWRALK